MSIVKSILDRGIEFKVDLYKIKEMRDWWIRRKRKQREYQDSELIWEYERCGCRANSATAPPYCPEHGWKLEGKLKRNR